MQLSHNNSKRRRQIAKAESDGSKIADYNKQLEEQLRLLEQAIENSDDPKEMEQGRAMIRRLKSELGEDFKDAANDPV